MSVTTEPNPVRPRVKPPLIRQACFDDYDQIARLETTVDLAPWPRERWLHLWLDNPAYHVISDWPIGWVLEDHEGRIVGSIGNIPELFHLDGREFLGASLVGWAVDPRYRAYSLMLVAHQLQHPRVDLQLVTTAGPMPQAVFTRLGWSRPPVGQWDQMAYWITNYAGAMGSYIERKMARSVSKSVCTMLCAPLGLADSINARNRDFTTDYKFAWCSSFDEKFDRFWNELLESNSGLFLSSRTKNTMKWHFEYSLERNDTWILTACDGSRLVGYAILQRSDRPSVRLTRMMLVDFQTLVRDPALSSAMFSCALHRCRRERIHILGNVGCWIEKAQSLVSTPSKHRALGSWCYLYKASNPDLNKALQIATSWYPTQYDGDASL